MNYKKVIEDYNAGLLKDWQVVMDNDGGYWQYTGDKYPEEGEDLDLAYEEMEEKYGSPDGYRDIVDVLVAAGVNCEWC